MRPSAAQVQKFVTSDGDKLEAAFRDGVFDTKLVPAKFGG
jgi:hypothetical protein